MEKKQWNKPLLKKLDVMLTETTSESDVGYDAYSKAWKHPKPPPCES